MNCFFNLSPMFKIYPGTIVSEKYIGIGNLLDGILQARDICYCTVYTDGRAEMKTIRQRNILGIEI